MIDRLTDSAGRRSVLYVNTSISCSTLLTSIL